MGGSESKPPQVQYIPFPMPQQSDDGTMKMLLAKLDKVESDKQGSFQRMVRQKKEHEEHINMLEKQGQRQIALLQGQQEADKKQGQRQISDLQKQQEAENKKHLEDVNMIHKQSQRQFSDLQKQQEAENKKHGEDIKMLQLQSQQDMALMQRQHLAEMEKFRRTNEKSIKEHEAHIQQLVKELDEIKEEPFDPKDPDRLMRKQGENFGKFCIAAKEYLVDVPKLKKNSIAVLGPSGVGKSTIINAFAGRKVAETDVIECTQVISMVHATPEYDMYDVPGSHDERADFYNVDNLHKLKSLHLILVAYTDRFQHALNVAKLLKAIELPFVMVRNKYDFVKDGDQFEKAYSNDQKLAGDIPLVFLGYTPSAGDIPANTDKLMGVVQTLLNDAGVHGGS